MMAESNPTARRLLQAALQSANYAVSLDYRQQFKEAIRAYGGACELLGQVKRVSLEEGDKEKLEAIVCDCATRPELQEWQTDT